MKEEELRQYISKTARSLFDRGLAAGSSGNISARCDEGLLMTPTGSSFGDLVPENISLLDHQGQLLSGNSPTKESFLHIAIYNQRQEFGAIVHLHSTFATAVSCLSGLDPANALPPITAYQIMKIGKLPLIPYYPPGDKTLAEAVAEQAKKHRAILLANHGIVVAGKDLTDAVFAAEELEQTAKIYLLTSSKPVSHLTEQQIQALNVAFSN